MSSPSLSLSNSFSSLTYTQQHYLHACGILWSFFQGPYYTHFEYVKTYKADFYFLKTTVKTK